MNWRPVEALLKRCVSHLHLCTCTELPSTGRRYFFNGAASWYSAIYTGIAARRYSVVSSDTVARRYSAIYTRIAAERYSAIYTGVAARRYSAIYTRTGDGGSSSTFTGERRPKDDAIFNALGSIDELSAVIGVARAWIRCPGDDVPAPAVGYPEQLVRVQCLLQEVASLVATPTSSARPAHRDVTGSAVSDHLVVELETWVDEHTATLPPLTNFILQGGGPVGSMLHLARTVCRRAERSVQPLIRSGDVHKSVAVYLNRLSDYLFTVARVAALSDGFREEIYRPSKPVAPPSTAPTGPSTTSTGPSNTFTGPSNTST